MISPAYPSAVNGLGDYASILGNELAKDSLIKISYAGLPQKQSIAVKPYHVISDEASLNHIVKNNKIDTVFLNYANYSFQKKGVPFWLLKEVKKITTQNIQFFIFFHELNATSFKPWDLVFWLKPLQVYLYRQLQQLATHSFCSNERVYKILKKQARDGGKKLTKLGVFSNIPEPIDSSAFKKKRDAVAIIFGSKGRRQEVYNSRFLKAIIIAQKISAIIDVGPGSVDINIDFKNAIINKMGVLNRIEIGELMTKCDYGLISYSDQMLGKSGIFAAYAAHSLKIFNFYGYNEQPTEGLEKNVHYISVKNFPSEEMNLEYLKKNIEVWYKERSLKTHTEKLKQFILLK